ncbi:MAG TPA: hypothetical protein VFR21_26280 [Bradyrhizobium sp.]|nr:hypothetical protein [Bradyrhizobium sp.]
MPLLLAGRVDFGSAELSLIRPAYFGIPPQEASRIGLRAMPRYVLTVENYASFQRHIAEAGSRRHRVDNLCRRLSVAGPINPSGCNDRHKTRRLKPWAYLSGDRAKWPEQEELDPVLPGSNPVMPR